MNTAIRALPFSVEEEVVFDGDCVFDSHRKQLLLAEKRSLM